MVDQQPDSGQSTVDTPAERSPLFTSDAALSFEEARSVTGRRGATLVLLMGEVGAGKTTLLVELWSLLLLHGRICNHSLAGSRTALAFEERAYHSRLEARMRTATTIRTHEANEGFLHLRIQRPDGSLRELLFADVTGEHFRRIREGAPLLNELPWAGRVDRFLVIVDGKGFATPGEREVILTRVRRQMYALRNSQAVNTTARVAIALTKLDELSGDHRERYTEEEKSLLSEIRKIDDQASALRIAARPAEGTLRVGMDSLVQWVGGHDRSAHEVSRALRIPASRAIGRFAP